MGVVKLDVDKPIWEYFGDESARLHFNFNPGVESLLTIFYQDIKSYLTWVWIGVESTLPLFVFSLEIILNVI